MKQCPYCAEQIQDDAVKCRYCGEFLDGRARPAGAGAAAGQTPLTINLPGMTSGTGGVQPGVPIGLGNVYMRSAYWGWEYKSPITILGWPLIHIANGWDLQTGRPRVARGIIAVGNIAIGVFALGSMAIGVISFGGGALGVLALGGLAVGGLAVGGGAIGLIAALGGFALSLGVAVGGMAIAPYAFGGGTITLDFLRPLLPWLRGLKDPFGGL